MTIKHAATEAVIGGAEWNADHVIEDAAALRTALGLADVATSGAYDDLDGRPALGSAAFEATSAFEPADPSILKSAAIGDSVQAYDAATAKTDEDQTFTALQDFSAGIVGGADSTTPGSDATLTLDGKMKVVEPSAAITLSFDTPAGKTFASAPILLKQGATAYAITWGSSATLLGTAPTMEADKAYLFGAFTPDGTTYYVQVGQAEQ